MTDDDPLADIDPGPPEPDDPVRPAALVLPAVSEPPLNELGPWLERAEVVDAVAVPGTDAPLALTADGRAITTTGIGKSDAATTVAALLATPGVDLESAYVVSCGIAGSSPETAPLGSVVVADAVVDWDRKHRWDRSEERDEGFDRDEPDGRGDSSARGRSGDRAGPSARGRPDDPDRAIDLLAYRPRDYVHRLEERVVETALEAAHRVDLDADSDAIAYQKRYPDAPEDGPTVETGTTVCGDEFWHGPRYAREVEHLCARYGVGPYATTQMEDAATARALERFGRRDRYLSVRAVANYDRSAPGESVEESFDGTDASLALAIENAARVGSAVVDELVAVDPLGLRRD
ncbi:phosphorylase family protein [Natrarchaeobius oligotrophus]|uniref:Phosphorylase n=1 Tax=Natrarchaeobius chitinivorans TaxID=1679083 RepID=A0A3N6MP78_NATCH|nr:phosphorylase [Natrarchaeobius chitinivorans]RQH03515.1 phosphorylase [Natrarchaeobius chitinivorans]